MYLNKKHAIPTCCLCSALWQNGYNEQEDVCVTGKLRRQQVPQRGLIYYRNSVLHAFQQCGRSYSSNNVSCTPRSHSIDQLQWESTKNFSVGHLIWTGVRVVKMVIHLRWWLHDEHNLILWASFQNLHLFRKLLLRMALFFLTQYGKIGNASCVLNNWVVFLPDLTDCWRRQFLPARGNTCIFWNCCCEIFHSQKYNVSSTERWRQSNHDCVAE